MKNNSMFNRVEKKVASMSPTELRLTCQLAERELDMRRSCWVHEMYGQFSDMERIGMAYAIRGATPDDRWAHDRIIVNCFTDKNRSKVTAGMSRLSPGDFFDYHTGVAIAFARAVGEPVPDLF